MIGKRLVLTFVLSLPLLPCWARSVVADGEGVRSGAEFVRKGNRLMDEGFFNQALETYDLAHQKLPNSAEVAYNRGIALYRLGRLDEAEAALQDALTPRKPDLEAMTKYNLGRCAHAAASGSKEDLQAAVDHLDRAIGYYNEALQLRPDEPDALKNLASAQRLQTFLRKKLEQQQEQQQQQDGDQEGDEQNEEGDQEQEGEQQSDQQGDQQQGSPSTQPNDPQQDPPDPSTQPAKDPNQEAAPDPGEDPTSQPEMPAASQPTTQPEDSEEAMKRISREQAMRMLQEARDAERRRLEQKRREQLRRLGRIPVDKDW